MPDEYIPFGTPKQDRTRPVHHKRFEGGPVTPLKSWAKPPKRMKPDGARHKVRPHHEGDSTDKARIAELEQKLAACEAALQPLQDKFSRAAKDNGGPEPMEYGPPAEIVTEVEPEPASDSKPRLIASDWLKGQMKPGESLAQARNRLLAEYNDLLNRNAEANFASPEQRTRFRDLTANMTDFSKG